jgi:hypothetical protein
MRGVDPVLTKCRVYTTLPAADLKRARTGPVSSAWFRNSESNFLGLAQLDTG